MRKWQLNYAVYLLCSLFLLEGRAKANKLSVFACRNLPWDMRVKLSKPDAENNTLYGPPPYPPFSVGEVTEIKADPEVAGAYLYKYSIPDSSNLTFFEGGNFNSSYRILKNYLNQLGYSVTSIGRGYTVTYPDVRGINARIKKMRSQNHPLAPFVQTFADLGLTTTSEGGIDYVDFARFAKFNAFPISMRGIAGPDSVSLHGHDVLLHGIGYYLFEPHAANLAFARLNLLRIFYTDPLLSRNRLFQAGIEKEIKERIIKLDELSASLVNAVQNIMFFKTDQEILDSLTRDVSRLITDVSGYGTWHLDTLYPYVTPINNSFSITKTLDELNEDEKKQFNKIVQPHYDIFTGGFKPDDVRALARAHAQKILNEIRKNQ